MNFPKMITKLFTYKLERNKAVKRPKFTLQKALQINSEEYRAKALVKEARGKIQWFRRG